MISMQIIVFKCKVNICDQDLGAYCQERGPGGKKMVGEGHGATEPAPSGDVGALMEAGHVVGGVGWCIWPLVDNMGVPEWLWELKSLLGWLWWHWGVLLS